MSKSKVTDYVINPYIGCQHGCRYCYATFIKEFHNISEEWGNFVYAKINCKEVLEKELAKKQGHIWLSSVTDCYQPIEAKLRLTRQILQTIMLYKKNFTIELLTKSALVGEDLDLLKELNAELGVSLSTSNEKIAKIFEPFASPPSERIEVLKKAKEKGIKVYGFISPVLPGITDLEELFEKLQFCDYVMVELLNTKAYILERLLPVVKEGFPDKLDNFWFAIKSPYDYYTKIRKEVERVEKRYDLKVKGIIRHG